jgi:hypothetical protein
MSMGSWILSGFGGAAFLSLATIELILYGIQSPFLPSLRWFGEFAGALEGLLLASYTGVLIGATAIPAWHVNRRLLPGSPSVVSNSTQIITGLRTREGIDRWCYRNSDKLQVAVFVQEEESRQILGSASIKISHYSALHRVYKINSSQFGIYS